MSTDTGYRAIVVDDDLEMRASLSELMRSAGWQVIALPRASQVAECLVGFDTDVILSDVRMPGMTGIELLHSLKGSDARESGTVGDGASGGTLLDTPPVVLITAHGDIAMAVAAMQDGAYSFLEKPFDPRRLLSVLQHAADQSRMRRETGRLRARLAELSGLDRVYLGATPEAMALRDSVLDMVDVDAPVLLRGQTGTGKELVARALHDLSARNGRPFVAVNCATLPETRFSEVMFGAVGSAAGNEAGLLQKATDGTLFLDEIGACPLPVQAQLLRLLEEREYTPVGATAPVRFEARILSATNADLDTAISENRFRSDLLFRLNTLMVTLPTLRERHGDIHLLFAHFIAEFAAVYEVVQPELSHDDLAALLAHDWPGNVRELRHVAERRILAARRGRGSVAEAIAADIDAAPEVPATLREAVAVFERELIAKAIVAHDGRMDAAAEALGIGRRTLNEKIVKLGLDKDALI